MHCYERNSIGTKRIIGTFRYADHVECDCPREQTVVTFQQSTPRYSTSTDSSSAGPLMIMRSKHRRVHRNLHKDFVCH